MKLLVIPRLLWSLVDVGVCMVELGRRTRTLAFSDMAPLLECQLPRGRHNTSSRIAIHTKQYMITVCEYIVVELRKAVIVHESPICRSARESASRTAPRTVHVKLCVQHQPNLAGRA